jgi:thiol:disulfide interchange protein DsbD
VLVRLYTDGRKPVHKENRMMLVNRYKTTALPYYVTVSPQDSLIGKFEGMTREPEQFVQFLRHGIDGKKQLATR